ncbi:GerW family sporulation protein [[Eubacterium] cellulosolvens]
MSLQNILQSIMDRLQGTASVKMVYGEPIETKEKTIVPVAKVAYGFGAGSGSNKKAESKESTGGGGGGGISVKPKGVLEITKNETRFISFNETRNLIVVLMIGLILGLIIGRRGSRR